MSYRKNSRSYECDFFISDLLREIYSKALKRQQIQLNSQYIQVRQTLLCLINSILLQNRSSLIDWLTSIGDTYQLQMSTIHLSATILDLFYAEINNKNQIITYNNKKSDYELYAICALMIAAKSVEKDEKIPKSGYLVKHLDN